MKITWLSFFLLNPLLLTSHALFLFYSCSPLIFLLFISLFLFLRFVHDLKCCASLLALLVTTQQSIQIFFPYDFTFPYQLLWSFKLCNEGFKFQLSMKRLWFFHYAYQYSTRGFEVFLPSNEKPIFSVGSLMHRFKSPSSPEFFYILRFKYRIL